MTTTAIQIRNSLWVEKHRPQTIAECVLPSRIKKPLQEIVSSGTCGNLLFSGPAGCGKTTAAQAICNELNCDWLKINCSEDSGIDTLRVKIRSYATSVSLSGQGKVVILDEFDYANPNSFQPALRSAIEEFSSNCRFVFTCNWKNRIIEPIHSRCTCIDFSFTAKERDQMQAAFWKRTTEILTEEGVKYDDKVVAKIVSRHAPDFRRILNELQGYAQSGEIDIGILASSGADVRVKDLADHMAKKDFPAVRKWVVENLNNDMCVVFRKVYDGLSTILDPGSIPQAIVILADYQYKAAFAADQEINLCACIVELMMNCEFKQQ